MPIAKPDYTRIWAAGASSGDIQDPDVITPGKFNSGWRVEVPVYQEINFVYNHFSRLGTYYDENGLPAWGATTDYPANAYVKSTVDNHVYVSLVANVNNEPSVSPSQWRRLKSTLGINSTDVVNVSSVAGATVTDALNALGGQIGATLTGAILHVGSSAAIPGTLECTGAAVSRTTYANLFATIGTNWGAGDGSTTFNIPDLRGEFLRAHDAGKGVDPGRLVATYQADELASHTHTVNTGSANNSFDSGTFVGDDIPGASGATGGSETRPRNVAVKAVIVF